MRTTILIAAALFLQSAGAQPGICLRSDRIDQIRMTGDATARATDRQGRVFDITFVAPCGARHPNVFFVIKPEFLPGCVGKGTALPTNSSEACVASTVKLRA